MKKRLIFAATMLAATVVAALPVGSAPSRTRDQAVRTLEAINIEGEIAVPQVLFITSRDVRRYRDGLRANYRRSTLDVARSFDTPVRLRVVAQPEQHKEEGK